jgi:hypothetical protein
MKMSKYLLPLLVIVALLGSVWIAKAAGLWSTSGRGSVLLDESGQPDPYGIKGWMTLADVSETYGVPLDTLFALIDVPEGTSPDTAMKELESLIPGFSMDVVRTAIADYLAGEHAAPPDVPPADVVTPEHTPQGQGPGGEPGADHATPTALPPGEILPADEIKGRMTLREVSEQCAVPLDYLYEQMGLPGDADPDQPLRSLKDVYGFEISALREVVRAYQE